MTSKRLVAMGLGVGLLAGSGAALVVNLPSGVGALGGPAVVGQEDDSTTDDSITDDSTTDDAATTDDVHPEPGDRLRDLLAPLVDDGTLTEAQVDAIVAELAEHRAERPRMHGRGGWHRHRGEGLSTAAEVIGISVGDLVAALRKGQTIAEVAQANGVDPQTVIDALADEAGERITSFVNEGPKHSATDEADG